MFGRNKRQMTRRKAAYQFKLISDKPSVSIEQFIADSFSDLTGLSAIVENVNLEGNTPKEYCFGEPGQNIRATVSYRLEEPGMIPGTRKVSDIQQYEFSVYIASVPQYAFCGFVVSNEPFPEDFVPARIIKAMENRKYTALGGIGMAALGTVLFPISPIVAVPLAGIGISTLTASSILNWCQLGWVLDRYYSS